jgi:hypothetical protein
LSNVLIKVKIPKKFMRTIFFAPIVILSLLVLVSGCRTHQVARVYQPAGKSLPPGQAKKVYGHQSAKAFAPGQQKKRATMVYPNVKVEAATNGKPNNNGKKKGKKK